MADTGPEYALEVENKHLREAIKELGRNNRKKERIMADMTAYITEKYEV